MIWPPVDSAEARELRELDADQPTLHPANCDNGWIGEDHHGRPRPCPTCRPHLATLPDGRVVHRATLHRRTENTP